FGGLAGFGIGNMVQSNSVADVLNVTFGIDKWISGIVMTVLVGFVLIGGVKRIGAVAQKVVPFMCVAYLVASV
ncbi:MAG: alanine:cation symporter family protein, partial [Limnobacter sp.]